MQAEELSFHENESITLVITADGRVIFPWWNPLAEMIGQKIGTSVDTESSNFCG